MAIVKIGPVGGIRPSVDPFKLEQDQATVADGLSLRFGDIRPSKADAQITSSGVQDPLTLYRFQRVPGGAFNTDPASGWVAKAGDVDFARGGLLDDATERTYYTGDGPPRATNLAGETRQLGLPAPAAPTVTLVEVGEYTVEKRSGDINHMIDTIVWAATEGLPSSPQWFGATNATTLSLTQRSAANGFSPEHPIQVVKGISGDGSTLTDPANFGFLLDPKLDGFWNGSFFCIPICAYGYAGEVGASFDTRLDQILDPWSESAPFLTVEQKASLRALVDGMFDLGNEFFKSKSNELSGILKSFDVAVSNGVSEARVDAVTTFYARSDITSRLAAAREAFAKEVNALANRIMSYDHIGS